MYAQNQRNSNLEKWENDSDFSTLEVMYDIPKYKQYWEPPLILHKLAPSFDERFIGYGFTRSSHVRSSQFFAFFIIKISM